MIILFYDSTTPKFYTQTMLQEKGLGGTEATVVRIAHGLRAYHEIYIAQPCRGATDDENVAGVNYVCYATAHQLSPDVVVFINLRPAALQKVGKLYPHARHFCWMHNHMSAKKPDFYRQVLLQDRYEIIAVSNYHKNTIQKRLTGKWYQRIFFKNKKATIPIHVLYNPIDDDLAPRDEPFNPDQLLFMSSPHKGLKDVLKTFTKLLNYFPDYQLKIASYAKWDETIKLPPQTELLGSLSHCEVVQQARESFCVFYPQTKRAETFGLVYAESNAVGTPVLAHDFGSAHEILSNPCQLVNGHYFSAILEKITQWRNQRPVLNAKSDFRLNNVVQAWMNLLATKSPYDRGG